MLTKIEFKFNSYKKIILSYQTKKLKLHSYNFSPTWGEIKRGV